MKVVVVDSMMARRIPSLATAVDGETLWRHSTPGSAELLSEIEDADVLVGSPFNAALAERAKSLRLVQLTGIGTEGVDFGALKPGTVVANTAHHERSIAEYVLMAMLALRRNLLETDAELRQGNWRVVRSDPTIPFPQTLRGRTLAIVGFGHIGQQIAKVVSGLDMNVMAVKRTPDPGAATRFGLQFLGGPEDLPVLLGEADYLVIALPLNDTSRGMIGAAQLEMMRRTAYLINVARGPIVDQKALFDALESGVIAGAAIDTWYRYPTGNEPVMPAEYPFQELSNVIMTPHNSGETAETTERRAQDVVDNINALASGQPLRNVVYPNA